MKKIEDLTRKELISRMDALEPFWRWWLLEASFSSNLKKEFFMRRQWYRLSVEYSKRI